MYDEADSLPGGHASEPWLRHSSVLGRVVRSGAPEELGLPTEQVVLRLAARGDAVGARRWLAYAADEKRRSFATYVRWLRELIAIGHERHPGFAVELERLNGVIGCPPPLERADEELLRAAEAAVDAAGFESALGRWLKEERITHHRQADWCWGILSSLRRALGEAAMEEVFRDSMTSWVSERYATIGSLSPRERLELTVEAMRAEFCGPAQRGDVDVTDEADRWVLSFDPCGTGGRMLRGDPRSRTMPPFDFSLVEGAHDWTWREQGVCLYCAHCSFVNEILPIEAVGTPLRVTTPPLAPEQPCRWVIYKSDAMVPDAAFERVGKQRLPR